MRKLLFLALGISTVLMSCQKEGINMPAIEGETFSVTIDNGLSTRAGEVPTRFIMELYELNPLGALEGAPVARIEHTTGSFNVALDNNVQYTALFFADYGTPLATNTNEYNADDLTKVRINKQTTKPAFAGSVTFTYDLYDINKSYLSTTLKHAVAEVNFIQSIDLTRSDNTLKVYFFDTYMLNIFDGSVTNLNSMQECGFMSVGKLSADELIGTTYIIANSENQTVMKLQYTFNNEVLDKEINNVPFRRNCRTNIKGAFSSIYGAAISVTTNNVWE